ncbi:MAG: NADH:ubiquinone reductase (Na(+)-transporting) subunit B [Bacteroidales bacterium]|nr:NADH:ubiquinone reductase (Na(+)-transporting) subunit B [Candidatus Cryptobacteroides choladohippi]MCQ2179752.1 NADH:ubiquinone reductase (Na(+)-transporting) subunit B [Bacteroidales bacterium]
MNKIFEKGGKLWWLHSTADAFDTFLAVPGTVTKKGSHVRDAVDLKRIIIIALIAAIPAALFGMWNVGYQHGLAIGDNRINILGNFWFGFLRVLPLYVVSYLVGLTIEFGTAQIRGEEVNEGFLMTGFLIPLIVPVDTPLWMLAIAVAFATIFGKEVFGGTGMNIWNPALLTRAFLFFSYPNSMSGSSTWIHFKAGEQAIDGFTGATPLALDGAAQYSTSFWSEFLGTIPGSVGETSTLCILLGAFILIWTGVASWKIMAGSVIGALAVGFLGDLAGVSAIPCWEQLVLGGFAFGTVFMATDPVTSAQTECGKWIYGFIVGALCITVRLFNPGYAEGMMLAILLGNTFAPLIDHCVTSTHISRKAKKIKVA